MTKDENVETDDELIAELREGCYTDGCSDVKERAADRIAALAASPPKVESEDWPDALAIPGATARTRACRAAATAPVESGVVESLVEQAKSNVLERAIKEGASYSVEAMIREGIALASSKEERVSELGGEDRDHHMKILRQWGTMTPVWAADYIERLEAMCAAQVGG